MQPERRNTLMIFLHMKVINTFNTIWVFCRLSQNNTSSEKNNALESHFEIKFCFIIWTSVYSVQRYLCNQVYDKVHAIPENCYSAEAMCVEHGPLVIFVRVRALVSANSLWHLSKLQRYPCEMTLMLSKDVETYISCGICP